MSYLRASVKAEPVFLLVWRLPVASAGAAHRAYCTAILHLVTVLEYAPKVRAVFTLLLSCTGLMSVFTPLWCCTAPVTSSTVQSHEARPGIKQRRHRENDQLGIPGQCPAPAGPDAGHRRRPAGVADVLVGGRRAAVHRGVDADSADPPADRRPGRRL